MLRDAQMLQQEMHALLSETAAAPCAPEGSPSDGYGATAGARPNWRNSRRTSGLGASVLGAAAPDSAREEQQAERPGPLRARAPSIRLHSPATRACASSQARAVGQASDEQQELRSGVVAAATRPPIAAASSSECDYLA